MKAEDEREGNGSRTNHARVEETTKNDASPLGVAHARAPEESPNQNKGCLNYEPDLGKTTRQTREGTMRIKEEEQLRN